MGGLSSARRAIAAAVIAGAATLALAGCENNLMTYLFKGIFYQGWKVASWSTPAPVVETETWELGKSNGFPSNMAMGSNGKLHLVCWKVSSSSWVYTSMDPGAAEFDQAFAVVKSTPQPDEFLRSPGIDLFGDDVPLIAYGVGYTGSTHNLYYQEYNPGSGTWSTQTIATNGSAIWYAPVFVSFLSDLESHIWYLESGTIKHTIASPPSSTAWQSGVARFAAVRIAGNDVAFVYSDTAKTQLFYRAWSEAVPTSIWTAPTDIEIGEMTITKDSKGAVYVCFGTCKTSAPNDTSYFTLRCLKHAGGTWQELESIDGTASAGPMPVYPCSITVAPDRYGNDHLHMVYTVWTLPSLLSVSYTYYEETGWHSPQNLDALHTSVIPQIAVDPAGTVHVVYSWYSNELDRTMMYVRGTPGEPQN